MVSLRVYFTRFSLFRLPARPCIYPRSVRLQSNALHHLITLCSVCALSVRSSSSATSTMKTLSLSSISCVHRAWTSSKKSIWCRNSWRLISTGSYAPRSSVTITANTSYTRCIAIFRYSCALPVRDPNLLPLYSLTDITSLEGAAFCRCPPSRSQTI